MTQRKTCPKCSHQRRGRNRNDKCLKVFENGNEFCHHCGYDSTKDESEWVPSSEYKSYKKPDQNLPLVTSGEFRSFFSEREIGNEVLKRNRVSWNGKEIMFPYFYNGEIFNIKYRSLDKKFRQETGALKGFFGLDDIIGQKNIYIVEGELDKLACEEAGFLNVSSVPDGAPSINAKDFHTKFEFIDNWIEIFDDAEKIIIAVDNDEPGHKLETELIRRFDPEKCWVVRWPEGCKDANAVLIEHGILTLMGCLDDIKRVPIKGIFQVSDFDAEYDDLYENGLQGGVLTGWGELDRLYTVKPGDLCIVTGRPGHGKSSFLSALLVNLANIHGWRVGVFSPENNPPQRYIAMLAQLKIGKPFRDGFLQKMTKAESIEARKWANEHFYILNPDHKNRTVPELLSMSASLVKMYGISGMVFDPWNHISQIRRPGQTETEYVAECLEQFLGFAKKYIVKVWIVAHPNKPLKEPGGKWPVPSAYDISGSAHWFNMADDIVTVWRDPLEKTAPTQVHIQKIRFAEVGTVGQCDFRHEVATGRFIPTLNTLDVTAIQEKPTKTGKDDINHFANNYSGQKGFEI
jgi:twinkle protein